MTTRLARIDTLVWVLIYGGVGLLMIGLWSIDSGGALAYGLAATGGLLAAIGVVLIWVRSRMRDASAKIEP